MPSRAFRRLCSSLILASLAAGTLIASGEPAGTGFTLAILRRDGILVPFASFDGTRWSNKWPAENASEVPITLADVPKDWWPASTVAAEWTAQLVSGRAQRLIVKAPAVVPVHCTRRVGLATDYVALEAPPPPYFQPYPKDGLATVGDVRIEPVQLVPPASREADALVGGVWAAVNEAETLQVLNWARVWQHPMDQRQRAKIRPTIELLARTTGVKPNTFTYYFESVKKYPGFEQSTSRLNPATGKPERVQETCNYITLAGGWVMSGAAGVTSKPSIGAVLTNCNREDVSYVLPLGAVRAAGRLFWIIQTSSWNAESYSVIEIREKDTKTQLAVMGGSCRGGN